MKRMIKNMIMLSLTFAMLLAMYGCTKDEAQKIKEDDSLINEIDKSSQALLALETYYPYAEDTVTITISNDGSIRVAGIGEEINAGFLKELYKAVYGKDTPKNEFQSDAFRKGGDTVLIYHWIARLYSWSSGGKYNHNTGSRYCRPE